MSGALGSTFICSSVLYPADLSLTNPYGIIDDSRACDTGIVENAMNFIAFTRLAAPFGTAQQSRFDRPCFQLMAAGTPAFANAAMRLFQTLAMTTSLSVSICGGTAPASHHFTTSTLILS